MPDDKACRTEVGETVEKWNWKNEGAAERQEEKVEKSYHGDKCEWVYRREEGDRLNIENILLELTQMAQGCKVQVSFLRCFSTGYREGNGRFRQITLSLQM